MISRNIWHSDLVGFFLSRLFHKNCEAWCNIQKVCTVNCSDLVILFHWAIYIHTGIETNIYFENILMQALKQMVQRISTAGSKPGATYSRWWFIIMLPLVTLVFEKCTTRETFELTAEHAFEVKTHLSTTENTGNTRRLKTLLSKLLSVEFQVDYGAGLLNISKHLHQTPTWWKHIRNNRKYSFKTCP